MNPKRLTFALLMIAATAIAFAAEKPDAKPAPPATTTTNAPSGEVIAYYFHGTVRCETCQKIEKQAREVVEQQFKAGLAAQQLMFKPVNYDLPENAHFLQDYQLPCPSLVIVRRKDRKDDKWKLLGDTWKLVEDTVKFNRYMGEEVEQAVRGGKEQRGDRRVGGFSGNSRHAGLTGRRRPGNVISLFGEM